MRLAKLLTPRFVRDGPQVSDPRLKALAYSKRDDILARLEALGISVEIIGRLLPSRKSRERAGL